MQFSIDGKDRCYSNLFIHTRIDRHTYDRTHTDSNFTLIIVHSHTYTYSNTNLHKHVYTPSISYGIETQLIYLGLWSMEGDLIRVAIIENKKEEIYYHLSLDWIENSFKINCIWSLYELRERSKNTLWFHFDFQMK